MKTPLPPPRAVIFDWDNTLVDSWPRIQEAMNTTLRHLGLPEWSLEETSQRVGHSLREGFPLLFGDRWEEAAQVYRTAFAAISRNRLRPLPGAEDLLAAVRELGLYCGVVSNKTGPTLHREVEYLGWTHYFAQLVGAGEAEQDKPAAAPLLMALAKGDLQADERVWFIGDTWVDMACAVNAGCTPILVRPSPPAPDEFNGHVPRHYCSDCLELTDLIQDIGHPGTGGHSW